MCSGEFTSPYGGVKPPLQPTAPFPKNWSGVRKSNPLLRLGRPRHTPYTNAVWSGQRESNPRHPRWRRGILPLNYDRPNLVEAEGDDPSLPVCRTGVLPIRRRPQIWYPVEGSSLRLPVCRTGALPSELTGHIFSRREQSTPALFIGDEVSEIFTTARILVGAKGLEPLRVRVRAGCAASRAPHRWSRRRESNAGFVRTGDALCH